MDPNVASFNATLAFARLALGMLFLANLGGWLLHDAAPCLWGLLAVIGATALSYSAQTAYTVSNDRLGLRLQYVAIALAFFSAVLLIQAGT